MKEQEISSLSSFYFTGMRLSELINIKTSDIDKVNSQIKVIGKRNKERLIPITFNTLKDLNEFINFYEIENFLFADGNGKKMYPKKVYRIVNKYLAKISSIKEKPTCSSTFFCNAYVKQWSRY